MSRWTADGLALLLIVSSMVSLGRPLSSRQPQSLDKSHVRPSEIGVPSVEFSKLRNLVDLYLDLPPREPAPVLFGPGPETDPASPEIVEFPLHRSRSPPPA